MRARLILPLIAFLAPVSVAAQPAPPPQRILNLTVYGEDPCPKSEGDEIVVCARRPESERYRIPKKLREKPAVAGGPGWGGQVATMEQVQRNTTPMGCSPVGGANTGCYAQMMAQWFAERRRMQSEANP
ncbi:MAG: hypothetical protein DI606_13885 [Sphingobium sp.]|jgi:hypothetical protein|uniref:hypothetical protein n=1 Tax=Sphingobium sp. TaxID=1912891 RepID=UPI000DB68FEC|nr:hypothetical protein [Sphingobium sp.]PZU09388.1 MAG: hypothetical protein DI606_13885 [Sphingobium sp.]